MYVTRPLSLYRKSAALLSLPPPEGPNSGILVIQDEEYETTTCFGPRKDRQIRDFPIPQNKTIAFTYSNVDTHDSTTVMLIPVLNQQLSSNLFYVINTYGKHGGEAYTSSKEEDMGTCCFCTFVNDVKSRPLDHHDVYQQFHIFQNEPSYGSSAEFYAKSVASDGFPPYFLRLKGWTVSTITEKHYELTEALGLDATLRAGLPDHLNFPLSYERSEPVVVGKWYCPFIFIKDGTLKDQFRKSPYYEMMLEQRWERIYTCESNYNKGNVVTVDVAVKTEVVMLAGIEALGEERNMVDGVIWFRGDETSIGLNTAIVERMKWEQERVGWIHGDGKQTTVKRTEEYEGKSEWKKYGCYILVESFVLKRVDQSVVLTYDFMHTHQINSKWE